MVLTISDRSTLAFEERYAAGDTMTVQLLLISGMKHLPRVVLGCRAVAFTRLAVHASRARDTLSSFLALKGLSHEALLLGVLEHSVLRKSSTLVI